jgi:hypothetical protein
MAQAPRKPTKAHLSRAAKDMHSPNKKIRQEAGRGDGYNTAERKTDYPSLSRFGSENQRFPPL